MSMKTVFGIAAILAIVATSFLNASLKEKTNKADYIIITQPEFTGELQELANYRAKEGFKVMTVTIPEIQAEFPFGQLSESIREFISYTLTYWQEPVPRYILLAGGINYIPSVKIKSKIIEEDSVSIDWFYAVNKNQDDNIADVALGRLPFRNASELSNMIDKIIDFESIEHSGIYMKDFLVVTDSTDSESFEQQAEYVIDKTIPSHLRVDRLYLRPTSQYSGTKYDLIDKLHKGVFYLINFMHANPRVWAMANVLNVGDLDTIQFPNLPSINVSVSCRQNFDDTVPSLVERLLSNRGGGLIANFASSGYNYSYFANNMAREFLEAAVNSDFIRIGDAALKSWNNMFDDEYDIRFRLLGDPALILPQWLKASSEELPGEGMIVNISPNPFVELVKVQLSVATEMKVSVEIFDLLGNRVAELNNSVLQSGNHSFTWDGAANPKGALFCRVSAGKDVFTKMIVCAR